MAGTHHTQPALCSAEIFREDVSGVSPHSIGGFPVTHVSVREHIYDMGCTLASRS
jgi:hypothetical protein